MAVLGNLGRTLPRPKFNLGNWAEVDFENFGWKKLGGVARDV